jgi:hypothetical protein
MKFRLRTIHYILAFALMFTFLVSCDELPCPHSEGAGVNVLFFELDGITEITIDSFSVTLLNKPDDPYADEYSKGVNSIRFPLSITDDSSTVILSFKDMSADTLVFYYTQELVLISHQCGFETFFTINEVSTTTNRIKSVWVSKELVEYGNRENIKIYF